MKTILLIEDNAMCAGNIARALTKTYRVLTASTGNDTFSILAKNEVNLILLDYYLPDMSGVAVLRRLASEKNTVPVIMITEETDPEKAVECIKKGALDYVPKNKFFKDPSILVNKVGLVLQEREYEAKNRAFTDQINYMNRNIYVPDIPEYRSFYKHAEQALKGNLSLLIQGESGVGKGMLVSSIHQKHFPDKPLITIDCGAIPSSLIEAELFGHQKGTFTGATSDKPGKIELANHGILFLDEIANASRDVQMKLLRVIQEKKVCRVGARKETQVDFMLISATNKDLLAEIEKNTFMEDLYYRIKQVEIRIPPLRQSPEALRRFIRYYHESYCAKYTVNHDIPPEAMSELLAYHWPGNMRELDAEMQKIVYFASIGEPYRPLFTKRSDLNAESRQMAKTREGFVDSEKQEIILALNKHRFNVSRAAKEIGMARTTMLWKMKKYGIDA